MICVYCSERATSIDHIRPRSRGGKDTEDNRVPCCQLCNSSKGNKLLTEWTDYKKVLNGIQSDHKIYNELLNISRQQDVVSQLHISAAILRIHPKIFGSYMESVFNVLPELTTSTGEMSLYKITEENIIPMNYGALRKAKQRDPNFPIGRYSKINRCHIYNIDDIRTWYVNRPKSGWILNKESCNEL